MIWRLLCLRNQGSETGKGIDDVEEFYCHEERFDKTPIQIKCSPTSISFKYYQDGTEERAVTNQVQIEEGNKIKEKKEKVGKNNRY